LEHPLARLRKVLLISLLTVVGIVALLSAYSAYLTYYGRAVPPAKPGTIRVACVGDSITFGNPFFASARYPQQLEDLLGSGYSVRNFGAVAFTAQKATDHPYWEHRYFGLSTEFAPNIVVIMLGTNDSKTQNWADIARFLQDYRALIAHYQSLPSKPRIILVTPPSTFLVRGHTELPSKMNAEVIAQISEGVKQIGASMGLSVADVHAATATHAEFFQFDGIHPNGEGSGLIAKTVYDIIITANR
jgi:acyl-CoA thioesterase-1